MSVLQLVVTGVDGGVNHLGGKLRRCSGEGNGFALDISAVSIENTEGC